MAERRSKELRPHQFGAEFASRVVGKAVGQRFGDAIHAGPSFFKKIGDDCDARLGLHLARERLLTRARCDELSR